MKTIPTFSTLLVFLLLSFTSTAQVYVNHAATGTNTGTNWTDAYTTLTDALNSTPTPDTIKVAEGMYWPDTVNGSVASTFLIQFDMILLGGYNALTGERDPEVYQTVLSGDLNNNDIDDDFNTYKSDNVMTVVTVGSSITDATLMDGFTIRGGYADGPSTGSNRNGGAIYCLGDPFIKQCVIEQNYAKEIGGGIMLNSGSNAVLENCMLKNNLANEGGALMISYASYTIKDCTFLENNLYDGDYQINGGAIFIQHSDGLIQDCLFKDNTALEYGGAVLAWSPSSSNGTEMEMTRCIFENNVAEKSGAGLSLSAWGSNSSFIVNDCNFINNESMISGGGISYNANGSANNGNVTISNCEFSENSSVYHGGGIRFTSGIDSRDISITVDSCSFIENTNAMWTGGGFRALILGENTEVTLTNSDFTGNFSDLAGAGAAIYGFDVNASGQVFVNNNVFENNEGDYEAGLSIGSGTDADFIEYTVTNCNFLNNHALADGGGIGLYAERPASFLVENCLVQGNTADAIGGGLGLFVTDAEVEMEIRNCIFRENTSPLGAAIGSNPYTEDPDDFEITTAANILFTNCLIYDNSGEKGTIGLKQTGTINLLNCTVTNNPAGGISLDTVSTISLQNTIMHNPTGLEYETEGGVSTFTSYGGNLFRDDSFASFALPSDQQSIDDPEFEGTSNFHLQNSSPGIDKGIDLENLSDFDLEGNNRVNGCVDIGAYESDFTAGLDCLVSNDNLILNEISIFPNPANNVLNVQWPSEDSYEFIAEIFDAQGKLISNQIIEKDDPINIQNLPFGFYTLKILDDQKVYIGRFVKH